MVLSRRRSPGEPDQLRRTASRTPSRGASPEGLREPHVPVQRGRLLPGRQGVAWLAHKTGNAAVAVLIQRQAAEERGSAEAGETEITPPAADLSHVTVTAMAQAADLGERARTATQSTWRLQALQLQAIYLAFPATHELPVRTLGTSIMARPQFVGRRLMVVRRGNLVKVLRTAGSWYYVQAPNGVQGWMSRNHLWAFRPGLRSGDTGTGTSRGHDMAGRA